MSYYTFSLLTFDACPVRLEPRELMTLLKAWRKHHSFQTDCTQCESVLDFGTLPYACCCQQFYYDSRLTSYPVQSIAVRTKGFKFFMPQLEKMIASHGIVTDQEFLVLPDPIYWQVQATLVYEKVMKFVLRLPVSNRTTYVHPPLKVHAFYKQVEEAPLNYGSLRYRSGGKKTMIRQAAYGKRCTFSMRGMIVPDASLELNEIRLPEDIVRRFDLAGQWILLNRMPSLQPGNFVALRVAVETWPYPCFGIPLEIVEAMNADFDGDECNLYLVPNLQSQAECATLLNSQMEMECFVMGLKLAPSQDMLVAYHKFYDEIDFLPYKHPNLRSTFQVIYDLYGSSATYECFNRMRRFYLHVLQTRAFFALTLKEVTNLIEWARDEPLEAFRLKASGSRGCLVTQVEAGAKGSMEHLHQMFGKMGYQSDYDIQNSLWNGLNAVEAVYHATETINALSQTGKIWEPGYGYSKTVFNLQGLTVDYRGRLVDGDSVVDRDVLNVVHYTKLLSEDAFKYLIQKVLVHGEGISHSVMAR